MKSIIIRHTQELPFLWRGRGRFLLLLLLCFTMGARAENVVTVSSTEGAPGDEVTVSIGLQNTDVLSSLQVSIPLDENLTLVEGSGQLGSRCAGHSLTIGVKDGVLNVFIYSISMAAISGTSGEVASFRLKLGNQPQTIVLEASKTVLTSSSGQVMEGRTQGGEVTTRCAKAQYSTMEVDFGEVPIRSTYQQTLTVTNTGNADLTITNLVFSDVMTFSSTTTLPIVVGAGDSRELNVTYAPVERGSISKTLKVECNCVSKLNTIKLLAQPFAVNELHIQDASGISDEEVTVTMTMNNMDDISGYQVEFNLPEQFEYVDGSFALSTRKQDHVAIASLNGQKLTLLTYSPSDKALTDNDGVIGTFRLKLIGRYGTTLTPSKTVLSATINNKVENVVSAVYGGQITIRSPRINTNNSLSFGAVSVTEACEKTFSIRNSGNAPMTISRIVFNNEALSINESLPIVITAGSSQNVTVVYSSVEQTSFDATMHIYSNDPDLRMKEVAVTGSRFAPNYLTFTTPDAFCNGNMKIEVLANTYDAIAALQFDVVYPSSQYEAYDGDCTLETRATGMTVAARQVNDNTLRFFCYFLGGNSIAAGNGKLMTIELRPKATVSEGSYNVSVSNIKLGTPEMADKYAGTDMVCSFNVTDFIGDLDDDGELSVTDVVLLVNAVMDSSSISDISKYDMDEDGELSVTDVVLLVNMVMNN